MDALSASNFGLNYFVNALPGVTIRQSGDSTNVAEGGATDSYTVVLGSIPTATVTITLDNTNNQVNTNVTTLTFTAANWNIPQTVILTAVNDTTGEGKHTGVIKYTVTSTDPTYNGMVIKPIIVDITDNDLIQRNPGFNAPVFNAFGLQNAGSNASPTFADIDGDGDLDAFIGNKYGETHFYRNTGTATAPNFAFQSNNFGLADVGDNANPAFADIDGDGDLDAFVGKLDGTIQYFRNNGNALAPQFVAQTATLGLTDVGSKANPTFADIDNDGDLDAFVGKGQGGAVAFFRNIGTANAANFVSEANSFGMNSVSSNSSPTLVDWDGDGDLDAIVGDFIATTFLRNIGTKTVPNFVSQTSTFGLSDDGFSHNPTLVDIDGDGDLDAFVGFGYGDTAFYLNTPPGINIQQSGNSTAVTEGGATDTFTVVLASIPKANVTITLDNTNNQVNTDKITLTFTAANWNIPQTVILTAVNDTVGEGKHNGIITYKVTSTDPDYNGMVVKPLAVTITDNDLATGNPNFIGEQINPFGLTTGPDGFTKPRFADIDGDGDLDLFAGFRYGDIQFYRNTGTANAPAFASPVNSNSIGLLGSNGGYNSPSFADIDGDGDLDAFIGGADGKLLFSRNVGTATAPSFVSQSFTFGIGDVGGYANPTFADIDSDGDLDAFIGANDGKTHFFRNIGSATAANFVSQANNFGITDVGDNTAFPSLVDFDGDGDLDAIVGDFFGNTQFFRNVGTATAPSFTKVNGTFGIPEIGDYAHPTFADIDGDGDLDAFIGEDGFDTPIHFLRNVSTNLVTIAQSGGTTNVTEGGANDTYTVVLKNQPTANVTITFVTNGQVSTNTANLVFTAANWNVAQTVTVTAINDGVGEGKHTGSITHVVTSADPAYQGAFSLPVVATITDNDLPTGNPNFLALATNPFGLSSNPSSGQVALVDIDGDGDLDAFQNGTSFGSIRFLRNVGSASAPSFVSAASNFGITEIDSFTASPSFADIDRDGDLDAFIAGSDGTTQFFRNIGTAKNPSFASQASNFGIPDVGASAKLAFGDIDNDGDLDVFVGNNGGATQFLRNNGTASAPAFVISASNFGITDNNTFARPTLIDIDGDGDLDMFVGDNTGNTQFFQNTGSASAPSFVSVSGAFGISNVGSFATPTFADIDGDGDMDAFVGNNNGEIRFFENTVRSRPVLTTPAAIAYTDTKFDDTFATRNGNLVATDANGGPLTFGIQGGTDLGNGTIRLVNSFGTLTVTKATGAYSFVANDTTIEALTANAAATFTVTVSDGLLSASKTLSLSLNQSGTTESNGNDNLVGTAGNDKFNALAGNDTLNGGLGVDTMAGGLGNDTYVVDNIADKVIETSTLATEIDLVQSSVSFTLSVNVENLVLTGGNAVSGTGNALGNAITGNSGANTLNGGLGVDTMTGGLGNDTYVVDNVGDKVVETSALATEVDRVLSAVSHTLTANVENLVLAGGNPVNGTGNALGNVITGNSGVNTLNGGLGVDTMAGGLGNDTYVVDNIADKVIETSALATEVDRVLSVVSHTLTANVENLSLLGSAASNGTGNNLANTLIGNTAANILNGGLGNDILTGGLGNDIFRLTTLTNDRITDFNVPNDTIQLENAVFTQLTTTGVLSANHFKVGAATDADDHVLYNSATGSLVFDSNGNAVGGATQIALLGIGLALTIADFVVI